MSSVNQKEGVFAAVCAVIAEAGREIVQGVAVALSTEERKTVISVVAAGLANGLIALSAEAKVKYPTVDKLTKEYVPGLVSNWLRKDLRLNGNVPYEAKKPGSRTGSSDEQLKNLKLLMSTIDDAEQKQAIQAAIDARTEELRAAKAEKIQVDFSKIPAELLTQLGLQAFDNQAEAEGIVGNGEAQDDTVE